MLGRTGPSRGTFLAGRPCSLTPFPCAVDQGAKSRRACLSDRRDSPRDCLRVAESRSCLTSHTPNGRSCHPPNGSLKKARDVHTIHAYLIAIFCRTEERGMASSTQSARRHAVRIEFLIGIFASLSAMTFSARADLLSFCTGAPPPTPDALAAYTSQCPSYLASQFAVAAAQQVQADQTARITQQQSQIATLTSLAALSKTAPASTTPTDLAGVSELAQRQDALLTFRVASSIGEVLGPELKSVQGKAFLATNADLATLFSGSVESDSLLAVIENYQNSLKRWSCRQKVAPKQIGRAHV